MLEIKDVTLNPEEIKNAWVTFQNKDPNNKGAKYEFFRNTPDDEAIANDATLKALKAVLTEFDKAWTINEDKLLASALDNLEALIKTMEGK